MVRTAAGFRVLGFRGYSHGIAEARSLDHC